MWLYCIVVNMVKNYLVIQGWCLELFSDIDIEEVEIFVDGELLRDINMLDFMLYIKQVVEMVNCVMEVLFEELWIVIIFWEIEGLSYEEIVEVMECLIGMVWFCIFWVCEVIVEKLCFLLGIVEGKWWQLVDMISWWLYVVVNGEILGSFFLDC